MPIKFRQPQDINAIRFGATLVWGVINNIVTTVTGVSPLALANALAKPIKSLVQTGKCVQSGIPTPSAPVDIVCNNGALKMVHRSGLPSGYKLLEYVGGNGSRNVLTDVYLASTDVVECEFKNSTTTGYGAMYGVFKLGESSAFYANQTYYGYDVDNNKVDTGIQVDTEWHSSRHDFVNGTLTVDDITVTFAPFEFENSVKNAVLSRYYNNNYGYSWRGYVRKFKVTRNGEAVCDLLPAKNSNDVAGLYDLVTGNFYEGMGGDLLEGNEVDDYELRVVGTPEVLTVSDNLLSRDSETTGKIITSDGTVSDNQFYCISTPFVLPAGNYTCTWQTGSGSRPFSVFAVDESGAPQPDGKLFYQQSATAGINTGEFAVEAETLVVASYRRNATDLAIYSHAQTASVVNLYQVGDYADTQDIVSGAVTRRVGMVRLTGDLPWRYSSGYSESGQTACFFFALDSVLPQTATSIECFCSHVSWTSRDTMIADKTTTVGAITGSSNNERRGKSVAIRVPASVASTVEEFGAWLAEQYAAGTPVIVMYPLAEETTEQTTPQPLHTSKGNNTITVDAEVDDINLEVTYYTTG